MFFNREKKPEFALGSIRILPRLDGLWHIEKFGYSLLSLGSPFPVDPHWYEPWKHDVDGFKTKEEAIERIKFANEIDMLINDSNVDQPGVEK